MLLDPLLKIRDMSFSELTGSPSDVITAGQLISWNVDTLDVDNDLANFSNVNSRFLVKDGSNADETINLQAQDLINLGDVGVGIVSTGARLVVKGSGLDILNLQDSIGSEKFTVLNNGNVGIGTDAPPSPLTVGGVIGDAIETTGIVLGVGQDSIEFISSDFAAGYGVKMQGMVGEGVTKLNYFARANSVTWPSSALMGIGSDNRISIYNKGIYGVDAFTTATLEIGYSGNQWYGSNVFRIGSDDTHQGDWLTMDNNGRMSLGDTTPDTSAILELNSTTGALILPRMTTVQKNALTPVNGMLLYDTTLNQTQTYENGAWRQL